MVTRISLGRDMNQQCVFMLLDFMFSFLMTNKYRLRRRNNYNAIEDSQLLQLYISEIVILSDNKPFGPTCI